MIVKPLLSLHGAPNLDAVLHEPFHHKGRFIVPAAQAVKHEHQQDVKLALQGHPLDFLDGVPILGRLLEAGNALLGKLLDDLPFVLTLDKLTAKLLLHGNVVFLHLPHRGNTVKTDNTLLYVFCDLDDLLRHIDLLLMVGCIYGGQFYLFFKVPSTPLLY